jgi:hypothetical protein
VSLTCESCGADESELFAVRRRYVVPDSWETPGSERVLDDVERWCFACCSHYPHVPAEG